MGPRGTRTSFSTRRATARCCPSCTSRLQDRQPDRAGPDHRAGVAGPAGELRLGAGPRRQRRGDGRLGCGRLADAPGHGRRLGRRRPGNPRHPARRAAGRSNRAPALADDRATQPERLDRAEGGQRRESGGLLARPPGPVPGRAQLGSPGVAGAMAAQLWSGGAVRPRRPGDGGHSCDRAGGRRADERQPAHQWRRLPAAPPAVVRGPCH